MFCRFQLQMYVTYDQSIWGICSCQSIIMMFFTHSSSWKSVQYMTTKMLHGVNTSIIPACARPQITVFTCTVSDFTVCVCCGCVCVSAASLLLQQGRDVDVPADGLSVEAAGEQVARLVLFIPRRTTDHSPVTLHTHKMFVLMMLIDRWNTHSFPVHFVPRPYHSVAAWKPGQPHSAHVKQADLSIVVRQSDDPLVGRDAYPERSDQVRFESGTDFVTVNKLS